MTTDVNAGPDISDELNSIAARLDSVVTELNLALIRLDVLINLVLDLLPEERFTEPRKLTHKVARLDRTGIELRPLDIGKMLGRPSKDISSRRREYKANAAKKVTKNGQGL